MKIRRQRCDCVVDADPPVAQSAETKVFPIDRRQQGRIARSSRVETRLAKLKRVKLIVPGRCGNSCAINLVIAPEREKIAGSACEINKKHLPRGGDAGAS